MIPILMAGDKKFLYHEKLLRKKLNIPITFLVQVIRQKIDPFIIFLLAPNMTKPKIML